MLTLLCASPLPPLQVILTDFPLATAPFYARTNDGRPAGRETAATFDILLPGIGEVVGGSQREERADVLAR